MRAVRLYGVGDLRVVDLPVPEIDGDEVLLQVRSVGVCGSDIPRVMSKGAHHMPITIGHEFSARIARVGREVVGWSEGERVTAAPLIPCRTCHWCRQGWFHLCAAYDYLGSRCDGAMAEYVKVPAFTLVRIPDALGDEEAAMTDPAATALHTLWRGSIRVGDTVVLYGVGSIALFMIQWARLMGARQVIAVDIFDDKLELALRVGATDVVNSKNQDPVAAVQGLTKGLGGKLVVESAALQQTQIQSVQSTGKRGTAVFLGISNDKLDLPRAVVDQIMRNELQVTGSWNSNSAPFPGAEWIQSVDYMANGRLQAEPLISHRYQLEQAPEVFVLLAKREIPFNKVIFNF